MKEELIKTAASHFVLGAIVGAACAAATFGASIVMRK